MTARYTSPLRVQIWLFVAFVLLAILAGVTVLLPALGTEAPEEERAGAATPPADRAAAAPTE